jgi:hypothetical protein
MGYRERCPRVSSHKATNEGRIRLFGLHSWPCAKKRQTNEADVSPVLCLLIRHRRHVEVEERPLMAVEVTEASHLHHAVIERAAQRFRTRCDGLVWKVVDLLSAVG